MKFHLVLGFLSSVGIASLASSAFADLAGDQQQFTKVSLADLKTKCADLQSNPQLKPIKVTITCNELSYNWTAKDPTAGKLENQRNVGAMVQMKGFQVEHEFFAQEAAATPVSCLQLVKVERKISNIDVELSCAELANVSDLGSYCSPLLTQRIVDDPALVTETPTTEVLSLCPAAAR